MSGFRGKTQLMVILSMLFMTSLLSALKTPLSFPSDDGVVISADYYSIEPEGEARPLIILFHQAGWSRGEYAETAPKLNALGFNCLAVDLRSGQEVNDVVNETAASARSQGKKTDYLDAWPDLKLAVNYAETELKAQSIILMGSSYSASMVLRFAGENPERIKGVVAFSPGEYFSKGIRNQAWVRSAVKTISVPTWISSAAGERSVWKSIYEILPESVKTFYLPSKGGQHGSRALWGKFPDSKGYWQSLKIFLKQFVES